LPLIDVCKAYERQAAAYTAVMAAPTAGPADILAKIRAVHPELWDEDHEPYEEEGELLAAVRRDLEALAGSAST
jgi:hypothetical protein